MTTNIFSNTFAFRIWIRYRIHQSFNVVITNNVQENLNNQQVTAIKNLVIVASRSGSWIFNTITKDWHSPEEFEAKYLSAPYEEGWYHRFKVLKPFEGIIAADKQIQKILEKKQDLVRRVIEYYQHRK